LFLRVIYSIWRYFTRFIAIVLVLAVVLLLFAGILAQIPYSKNYLKVQLEQYYTKTYQSELSIGSISGFIPFSVIVDDILIKSDSTHTSSDTLIYIKTLEINLNPIDLISNRLSVQSLSIAEPLINILLEDDGHHYHLDRALSRRESLESEPENVARKFEILSPFFSIRNGSINFETREGVLSDDAPQLLKFTDVEISSFIELNDDLRFLDIQYLIFELDQLPQKRVRLNGQIYSDENYLELNGFRMSNGTNSLSITGEAANVNLYKDGVKDQLLNAIYRVNLDVSSILLSDFRFLNSELSKFNSPVILQTNIEGPIEDLSFNKFDLQYGENRLEFVGGFKNLLRWDDFAYDVNIRTFQTRSSDFSNFISVEVERNLALLDLMSVRGRLFGDLNRTDLELRVISGDSEVILDGDVIWDSKLDYQLLVTTSGFDLQDLQIEGLPYTVLNSNLLIKGTGSDLDILKISMEGKIYDSTIDDFTISEVTLISEYADQKINSSIVINDRAAVFSGRFNLDHSENVEIRFVGDATNVNLKNYIKSDILAETELDFNFNLDFSGATFDDLNGRLNLDVNRAVVNSDTLGPHQFYADLTDLSDTKRELRFTSTLLDFTISGDLMLSKLNKTITYWITYFENRLDDEILFTDDMAIAVDPTLSDQLIKSERVDLTFFAVVKNASLLNAYILTLPYLEADLALEGMLNADKNQLLLNGKLSGTSINYNEIKLENFKANLTSSLRHNKYLREYSAIDLNLIAEKATVGKFSMGGLSTNFSMLNDSIKINTDVVQIGDGNYGGGVSFTTVLSDSLLKFNITDFEFGNYEYKWIVDGNPVILLTDDKKLIIDELNFINEFQQFSVSGVYSQEVEDEVMLEFKDLDLGMISSLIAGDLSFNGTVNGAFKTSSLFTEPSISGDLFIDHFQLDNRTIGDVNFRSVLNVPSERFDINVDVSTHAEKYSEYLASNNNIGQDINITGWINTPDNPDVSETLYSFDVVMNQIDAWIITPIIPDIFISTEGIASGQGRVWGTIDYFDFTSEFDVQNVLAVPQFLKTNYNLQGKVLVSRDQGVVLDNINVRDNKGGTGLLNGTVSFNDFNPERPLNLTLRLNRLEFLNNTFEPDVPFYGNVSGTGVVSLTGTNVSPFLRTTTPVTTTSDSRLAIPLLDETSVEEQSRFIEFVKSFSEVFDPPVESIEVVQNIEVERSFLEVFRLDLQFIAAGNTTVQLVFDPLTGEILNATGGGRIRITLEDEELQMFGSFNISGGDYTFVGGDIFVRRFQLRDGGTISWDGDPANARLNITTAYRSRPNIGVLTSAFTDQQSRIPVDLILEITGTIQRLENNFFFEFPNAIDVSQNATELSLLNSEDQKLVQATSLLFTGGFIPVGTTASGQGGELGSTLQARAGQVGLSQLLSNQINAILNNSLSILDVDFNLTGFDQADIGIALRLFDDRLILRGESQYSSDVTTGAETTLGDFGLTYRINRSLSLEVFHRRDPTLRSIVGNQSQAESINGIGLEAQFQFNTWSEFRMRVWGQIRRIFGVSSEDEQTTLTQ
jgi:hypothetical protein